VKKRELLYRVWKRHRLLLWPMVLLLRVTRLAVAGPRAVRPEARDTRSGVDLADINRTTLLKPTVKISF
jgi:hypothetical protein